MGRKNCKNVRVEAKKYLVDKMDGYSLSMKLIRDFKKQVEKLDIIQRYRESQSFVRKGDIRRKKDRQRVWMAQQNKNENLIQEVSERPNRKNYSDN